MTESNVKALAGWKKVLFMVTTWILVLVLINWLSGFIAKDQDVHVDFVDAEQAEETFGYFRPNQQVTLLFPGLDPYKVRINGLGLRWTGLNLSPENIHKYPKRILSVGDSMAFAQFIDDEYTYAARLQELFLKDGQTDTAVLNAGTPQRTITDYMYHYKVKRDQIKPAVVLMNFYPNDLNDYEKDKAFYEKVLEMPPPTLGERIKKLAFMRMFRRFYVFMKYRRWLSKTEDPRVAEILRQNSKDLDDILYVMENYTTERFIVDLDIEGIDEKWEGYLQRLKAFADMLEEDGVGFVVLIQPDYYSAAVDQRYYAQPLINFLKRERIPYVDIIDRIIADRENILDYYTAPPRDIHMNEKANAIMAGEAYAIVKDMIK